MPGARTPLAPRPLPLPTVPAAGGGTGGRQEKQGLRRQRRLQERGLQEGRLQERKEQRVRGRRWGGRLRLGREALPSPVMQPLLVGRCLHGRAAAAAAAPAPASPAPAGRRVRGARHRAHSRPKTRTRPRESADDDLRALPAPWRPSAAQTHGDTGRPAPGPRSLPRSLSSRLPEPGLPRRLPSRATSRGAARPHKGSRRPRWGRGLRLALAASAAGTSRGPARPPATRKCLLAAASSLHRGPRRPHPAPGGAVRGCGRRARVVGPPPPASPVPGPGGGGQAVSGRLQAGCPRRRTALRWPRARLPCQAGSQVPGPDWPAAESARAACSVRG